MTHECNTRSKMVDTDARAQQCLTRPEQNIIDSLKDEISNGNSSLKDEINNLKDAVIKRLREENLNLQQKWNKRVAKIVKFETEQNSLAQYGRRSNIVFSGIPEPLDDNNLDNTVISMISDINVYIEENDIDACHRFTKTDARSKLRKSCSRIFGNKKKLAKLNNEKHKFRGGVKLFVSESSTLMDESIAFNCRKLKRKELIHSCYSRNGIINIRMTDKTNLLKYFIWRRY